MARPFASDVSPTLEVAAAGRFADHRRRSPDAGCGVGGNADEASERFAERCPTSRRSG